MAIVVLALTGFSSGHKSSGRHKSSHRDSDSGGGCSSSRQNHDSYTPRTSSTRSSSTLRDGTALVVSCATKATPYATVEVTNPNSRQATFEVEFAFADAAGKALSSQTKRVTVPARGTSNVQVKASPSLLAELDHCQVEPEADLVN
ncbi:hypothetical protein [Streptomyces canus]|uniref:hypothetical protein n=1 Tax=Streptomyces canus TaxID=58343 RepID=UPI002DD80A0E|nr:hypothetical protein [Streptomyces canus]WSD87923.1 hypothetical protein OG925_28175 [Streptomyces canus]